MAFPIGKVTLPITFHTPENYRIERISFEVINFRSLYHSVLSLHAFAKFMAAPHYTYKKMKMPGHAESSPFAATWKWPWSARIPYGANIANVIITDECNNTAELAKYPTDNNDPTILEKPTDLHSSSPTFQASTDTRRVNLVDGDSIR
jgi:hypothetical protein